MQPVFGPMPRSSGYCACEMWTQILDNEGATNALFFVQVVSTQKNRSAYEHSCNIEHRQLVIIRQNPSLPARMRRAYAAAGRVHREHHCSHLADHADLRHCSKSSCTDFPMSSTCTSSPPQTEGDATTRHEICKNTYLECHSPNFACEWGFLLPL